MPELPEVTTITDQLKKEIVGATITDVESIDGYRTQPEFSEFKKRSQGSKIISVERIAKTIVVGLGRDGLFIVIHLAMTGRLLLREPEAAEDPWTRLIFRFGFPQGHPSRVARSGLKELRFCDARMFGHVRLLTTDELEAHKKRYGPDALDPKLDPLKLLQQLRRRKSGVKRFLLEQAVVAGVGNIYANDSLWLSKIHPETPTQRVTSQQAASLLRALQALLKEAIEHRGSTLDDKMYVDLYGRVGEHQNYFRIYGKAGQPCPSCSAKIEFLEMGGRGTFFCPRCQKMTNVKKQETLL